MKKLTAIFLLTVFIFNTGGYQVCFYFQQQSSDKNIQASLKKNNFDENELVRLSVPLSMPYQASNTEFENVNGEINFKGKIYKYVKRRIEDGNLVLICLPDHQKEKIQKAKTDYVAGVNDGNQNTNSTKSVAKKFVSEYDEFVFIFSLRNPLQLNNCFHTYSVISLLHLPKPGPERPPQNLA